MFTALHQYAVTGAVLRRIRLQHGWTQRELAEMAHCNISTVSAVERGLRPLSDDLFLTLCRSLDCTPAELLKDE